jgi:hypothetical protein
MEAKTVFLNGQTTVCGELVTAHTPWPGHGGFVPKKDIRRFEVQASEG